MQHDFILLDRSGSMSRNWVEAVTSVNAYVRKLAEDNVDTGVTLAVFDAGLDNKPSFDIIRERVVPSTWPTVGFEEVVPRGGTPLNDSVSKIVALARAGNYDKVAIIIMTDGHENASKELKGSQGRLQAKALLDDCRAKGWQVIFLGADFDNAEQAVGYGAAGGMHVNSSSGNFVRATTMMASKRALYGSGQAATMSYTEEEKADLAKKK